MKKRYLVLGLLALVACSPNQRKEEMDQEKIKLITLDPGHFHAALVQKSMYPQVDSTVHVYAPDGPDLESHLALIESYNQASQAPTSWNEVVYTGGDFLQKMLAERAGNVVVLAGNNKEKIRYIQQSIDNGFHVFADKPMAIDQESFQALKATFETAKQKGLTLYDIMTERYEITTIMQREFSMMEEIFGVLVEGSLEEPAITKESVHHFYKYVSGNVLTRPSWFFDVNQQGEGIVDVTTHLVDLVQWESFPEQSIDYQNDIELLKAKRWSTELSREQFSEITGSANFPEYLQQNISQDSILNVYANGEINYKLKGKHVKVSVTWAYKAPEGTADTHYSIMRGSKANLIIQQGKEQDYLPELYIEPTDGKSEAFEETLHEGLEKLNQKYPGLALKPSSRGWQLIIPQEYKEGHEAHFSRVTEKFIGYLTQSSMPAWEVPNMIAKYYTTTAALAMAKQADEN